VVERNPAVKKEKVEKVVNKETLQISYMDKDKVIKHLQEKYPEDLNDNYKCYWWYTADLDGNSLSYYVILYDNIFPEQDSKNVCLRAHSSDPESLENLLKLYLETCKY
jgi:hypothetical protein